MKNTPPAGSLPVLPVVAIALSTLIVFAGASWFAIQQTAKIRELTESELRAIADSKAEQIVRWKADQIAEGAELSSSRHFVLNVRSWLSGEDAGTGAVILSRFHALVEHYGYVDIMLLDPEGRIRLSLSGGRKTLDSHARQAMEKSYRLRHPVMTDLHPGAYGDPGPHLGVVAPLSVPGEALVGGVLMVIDARTFLFPLLESKVSASRTVEALLVRGEGDGAVILNDPGYTGGTAPDPPVPSGRTDVPELMAIRGVEGFVRGVDRRGTDVYAVLEPIPGSSWHLVVGMGVAEATGMLRTQGWLLAALLTIALLLAYSAMAAIRQRHLKGLYQTRYEAESARRSVVERYGVVLRSIGDAVIVTDAEGRIELLNPVAESLTGWKEAEALGTSMHEVFRVVDETTRTRVESPVETVMREGTTIGPGNHTLLVARDGREVPIADAGAPVRDEDGRMSGVVLVFRDQTAAHAALRALGESERRFRRIYEQSPVAYQSLDADGRIVEVNPAWRTLLGFPEGTISGTSFSGYLAEDSRKTFAALFEECSISGVCHGAELELTAKDGSSVIVSMDGVRADEPSGDSLHAYCVLHNITERKLAERQAREAMARLEASRAALLSLVEEHRAAEAMLAEQVDELRRWHEVTSGRENRILELKRQVNELLGQAGRAVRYPSVENDMDEDELP